MGIPTAAKDLRQKLLTEKVVDIAGSTFRIRKVSLLLLLEEPKQIWAWGREGGDVLKERVKELLQNPAEPMMRRVILKGVVDPMISDKDGGDASVPVDMILANTELSTGLFIEIVNMSLGG